MIIGNPMTEKWDKRISLIVEATISIYLYVLLSLTNFMGENTLREELGWILSILIGIIVAINVSIFFWKWFSKAVSYIKEKFGHLLIKKASKGQYVDS